MSEQPYSTYEQTLVKINDNHASAVRKTRYSPWRLGLYVSLALGAPIGGAVIGYQVQGQLGGFLGVVLTVPLLFFVGLYAYDGFRVEHQRMVTERLLLKDGPVLPEPPLSSSAGEFPPVETPMLRPGILANGKVIMAAPALTPERARLKSACLLLMRTGSERGSYTRSSLAEGLDPMMPGELWDLASPELQRLGYLWNKPGKGGGLRLSEKLTAAEVIERLEAAQ